MLAARLSIVKNGVALAQYTLAVTWTDDLAPSTKLVGQLEHYVAQEEGLIAVHDALSTIDAGDTAHAGEQLRLARPSRRPNRPRLAHRRDRPAAGSRYGRVPRAHIDKGDHMELATRAVRTIRIHKTG